MMKKGVTLVELLIVVAISLVLSLMIFQVVNFVSKSTKTSKEYSDLLELYRTTEAQLKYYFDRWGIGVPYDSNNTTCEFQFSTNIEDSEFPNSPYCLKINAGNPCDSLEFFIGTPGYMIILHKCTIDTPPCVEYCNVDESDASSYYANYACYMQNDSNIYYYVWRKDKVIDITRGDVLNVYGGWCAVGGDIPNGCIGYVIPDAEGNWDIVLQEGDMILRIPKKVKIYCEQKEDRWFLYVDEDEVYEETDDEPDTSTPPYPLAPVQSVSITPYPEGCNAEVGECKGIIMRVVFQDYEGVLSMERDLVLGK